MPDDRTARPGRLNDQASPYLAAHADDPVDWRAWGEKPLKNAARTGRPLLISIGYQSCHWCHVMQRESFKDPDTAGFINRHFVPVKIDRELRPDVDALYMSYVAASTGSAGWPLTVFATPEGIPFFGGTYFPASSDDPAQPTFRDVLDGVLRAWKLSTGEIEAAAVEARAFLESVPGPSGDLPGRAALDEAFERLETLADSVHGGFGRAPKFPQAPATSFLLAYHRLTGEPRALELARSTVLGLLRGGIYDHVGGGIFRYATDEAWTTPHFEKMLYDQGLLLGTLAGIARLEPDPALVAEYADAARETAAFLDRELDCGSGGFYSSLDAESDGVEGAFYTWGHDELSALLSPAELELAARALGVGAGDAPGVLTRRSGRATEDSPAVDAVLSRLRDARSGRNRPATIRNVIVSWNAIAARGLIEAGAAFGERQMTDAGLRTLASLEANAMSGGTALHAMGDDSITGVRLLEDSAALVATLISAEEYTKDREYGKRAVKLHRKTIDLFMRPGTGLVMTTGDRALPIAPFERTDGPTPSGAALVAENAIRLAMTGRETGGHGVAEQALRQFAATASSLPYLAGHALTARCLAVAQETAGPR